MLPPEKHLFNVLSLTCDIEMKDLRGVPYTALVTILHGMPSPYNHLF